MQQKKKLEEATEEEQAATKEEQAAATKKLEEVTNVSAELGKKTKVAKEAKETAEKEARAARSRSTVVKSAKWEQEAPAPTAEPSAVPSAGPAEGSAGTAEDSKVGDAVGTAEGSAGTAGEPSAGPTATPTAPRSMVVNTPSDNGEKSKKDAKVDQTTSAAGEKGIVINGFVAVISKTSSGPQIKVVAVDDPSTRGLQPKNFESVKDNTLDHLLSNQGGGRRSRKTKRYSGRKKSRGRRGSRSKPRKSRSNK